MAALMREFAEELFLRHDFAIGIGGDPKLIYSDLHVMRLNEAMRVGKAAIEFLGVMVDLTVLRHDLSFLVIIDDDSWSEENPLTGSTEAKTIYAVEARDIRKRVSAGQLHSNSAALLQLALEHEAFRSRGITEAITGGGEAIALSDQGNAR